MISKHKWQTISLLEDVKPLKEKEELLKKINSGYQVAQDEDEDEDDDNEDEDDDDDNEDEDDDESDDEDDEDDYDEDDEDDEKANLSREKTAQYALNYGLDVADMDKKQHNTSSKKCCSKRQFKIGSPKSELVKTKK